MGKKKFHILSVDGGGLKGLIAVKILEAVSAIAQKPVTDIFEFFAGTSTGGLIVSALNVHDRGKPLFSLPYLEELYLQVGQKLILQGSFDISGNQIQRFNELLESTFKNNGLSDALRPVFVPAYDLVSKKIVVFKTRSALADPQKDVLLSDVCRATAAIPPVFPPYELSFAGKTIRCVDAGVQYLRNPAIAALAEVWKHREYYAPGSTEEDIVLISVSTGSFTGGDKHWTTDIQDITNEAGVDMQYIREQQLDIDLQKVHFLRIDLDLGRAAFSPQQFVGWMNDIAGLENDRGFRQVIRQLLV